LFGLAGRWLPLTVSQISSHGQRIAGGLGAQRHSMAALLTVPPARLAQRRLGGLEAYLCD
jgi:hypothetical protein